MVVSAVAVTSSRTGRSSWVFALLSLSLLNGVQFVRVDDSVGSGPQVVSTLVDGRQSDWF